MTDARRVLALLVGVFGLAAMLWGGWILLILLGLSGEYLPEEIRAGVAYLVAGAVALVASRILGRR